MSVAKRAIEAKRQGKKRTLAQMFNGEAGGGEAEWESASPGHLCQLVYAASENGGAVRFGYSRDGGAYAVGLYADGETVTLYHPCTGDVDGWLQTLTSKVKDMHGGSQNAQNGSEPA